MKSFFKLLAIAFLVISANAGQNTFTVEAGPIWNNSDAQKKCPTACDSKIATWNGQWWTTVQGKMSVCQCTNYTENYEAGPIWNNADAQKKCPYVTSKHGATWNGQWWTTVQGKMSVCQGVKK